MVTVHASQASMGKVTGKTNHNTILFLSLIFIDVLMAHCNLGNFDQRSRSQRQYMMGYFGMRNIVSNF